MKVYIQWAMSSPEDYVAYELDRIQNVRGLPKKALPIGGEVLDNLPGWLADMVVQGVSFAGWDHVSVAFPGGGALSVIGWNDDPVDFPEGPYAHVWTFYSPAPDPRYGNAINTRQSLTVYTDVPEQVAHWTGQATTMGPVTIRPWSDFSVPASNVTLHGIWQADTSYEAHRAVRTAHGWREWVA